MEDSRPLEGGRFEPGSIQPEMGSPPASPKAGSKTTEEVAQKTNEVTIKLFAKGAAKHVGQITEISSSQLPTLPDASKAYYFPVEAFIKSNQKEMRKEHETMNQIKEALGDDGGNNLAIEAKEVEFERVTVYDREGKPAKVKTDFILEVEKAEGDAEDAARGKLSMDQRVSFASQITNGFAKLHEAGFSHGDVKLENALLYKDDVLKLSDFGKTKKGEAKYTGNPRHAPPEGVQSPKGDVWGAGIMMIRVMEEAYLQENEPTLLEPDSKALFSDTEKRGVEKYIINHSSFPAGPRGSAGNLAGRLKTGRLSENEMLKQQEAMHSYIDELRDRMIEDPKGLNEGQVENYCSLLKEMTMADPDLRLSSEDANKKMQEIFQIVF